MGGRRWLRQWVEWCIFLNSPVCMCRRSSTAKSSPANPHLNARLKKASILPDCELSKWVPQAGRAYNINEFNSGSIAHTNIEIHRKLEVRTRRTMSSCVCLRPLGPWSCCDLPTFHLLTPKTEAFIVILKCINAENVGKIQSSNFEDIAITRPKSAFSSMLEPPWPWTFNLDAKTRSVHPSLKMNKC